MINPLKAGKNIMDMRKEAKRMENQMSAIEVEGESKKGWVKVKINGMRDTVDIEIDDALLTPAKKKDLVNAIKEAEEDASKRLQKRLQKEMMSGGMDMEKLKSMLGA